MILQEFELPKYDWTIDVFYVIDNYCIRAIESLLDKLECDSATKKEILKLVEKAEDNKGVTYSNPKLKRSLTIIGPSTSAEEFANTYDHEKSHLVRHIANTLGMDVNSENYAHLSGEIAKEMFVIAKDFMCDSCREEFYESFKLGR